MPAADPPSTGSGTAAIPAVTLPCVSFGPASRSSGSAYRVLHCASAVPLRDRRRALLNDFALSLYGWAQSRREGATFTSFFPIEGEDDLYLLVRARHLGEAGRGQIAVAHGAFVDRAAMAALHHRPHRALDELPEPGQAPWQADFVTVGHNNIDRSIAAPAGLKVMGDHLMVRRRTAFVHVANGVEIEQTTRDLLETVNTPRREAPLTWSSTVGLGASGRFEPLNRSVILLSGNERVPGGGTPEFAIGEEVVFNQAGELPPAYLPWCALFDRPKSAPLPRSAARQLYSSPACIWPMHYAELSIDEAVADTIRRLATGDMDLDVFWALLSDIAASIVDFDGSAVQRAAARGVVRAFAAIVQPSDISSQLLRDFVANVPLAAGRAELQALAVERGAVAAMGADLPLLLGDALTTPMEAALAGVFRRSELDPAGIAAMCRWFVEMESGSKPVFRPALIAAAIDTTAACKDVDGTARRDAVQMSGWLLPDEADDLARLRLLRERGPALRRLIEKDPAATTFFVRQLREKIAAANREARRGFLTRSPIEPVWPAVMIGRAVLGPKFGGSE